MWENRGRRPCTRRMQSGIQLDLRTHRPGVRRTSGHEDTSVKTTTDHHSEVHEFLVWRNAELVVLDICDTSSDLLSNGARVIQTAECQY